MTNFIDLLQRRPGPQIAALAELRDSSRPVMIYGAGVYAYVVLGYLRKLGLTVKGFAVDAAHRHGEHAHGLPLLSLEDCPHGTLQDCAWVLGISNYQPALLRLQSAGVNDPLVVDVPDFLNMPADFIDWEFIETHRSNLQAAYELLADELSRQTFAAALNAKLNQDARLLLPIVRPDHLYFWHSEYALRQSERLLDVGGFDGDSLRDFHRLSGGRYDGILSLEPFPDSYTRLQVVAAELDPQRRRIRTLPSGAWDVTTTLPMAVRDMNIDNRIVDAGDFSIAVETIDRLCDSAGFEPSLIKMDINGAELRAIAGARNCLRRPDVRLVSKLHVKEDFYRMPLLLAETDPQLRVRLRQRNYMSMMLVLQASHED